MSWIKNAKDYLAYAGIVQDSKQPGRNGLKQLERQNSSAGRNYIN
jgi:hypothetical protein